MNLTLQRLRDDGTSTMGRLALPSGLTLQTLELTWKPDPQYPGGQHDVSCVPAGIYDLVLHDTPTHPQTFALVNEQLGVIHEPDESFPNARVACLIHVANWPSQLEGCIGLGLSASADCIIESAAALHNFKAQVPWEPGNTLEILPIP
jgi:hypothetical protein